MKPLSAALDPPPPAPDALSSVSLVVLGCALSRSGIAVSLLGSRCPAPGSALARRPPSDLSTIPLALGCKSEPDANATEGAAVCVAPSRIMGVNFCEDLKKSGQNSSQTTWVNIFQHHICCVLCAFLQPVTIILLRSSYIPVLVNARGGVLKQQNKHQRYKQHATEIAPRFDEKRARRSSG